MRKLLSALQHGYDKNMLYYGIVRKDKNITIQTFKQTQPFFFETDGTKSHWFVAC